MAGGVVLPWSLGREAVETPAGLIGASAALPLFLPRMITSYETRCNYRAWFGHQATDPLRFAVPGYGSDQPMAAAISPGGADRQRANVLIIDRERKRPFLPKLSELLPLPGLRRGVASAFGRSAPAPCLGPISRMITSFIMRSGPGTLMCMSRAPLVSPSIGGAEPCGYGKGGLSSAFRTLL
jgi:hypothetical protein